MKFTDYQGINAKLEEFSSQTEMTAQLPELFGNPYLTILYRHTSGSSTEKDEKNVVIMSELQSVFADAPQNLQDNTLIADVTEYFDGGMGGGGGIYIPDPHILFDGALTFIINKSIDLVTDAALLYVGKKTFEWLKGKTKNREVGKKANIKVVINNKNTSFTFVFFHFFDKDTFVEAWKKMIQFTNKKHIQEKGDQGIVIFDATKKDWEIVE